MLAMGFLCYAAGQSPSGEGFGNFTQGMLQSCEDAVYFVIGLIGIMGLWSGFTVSYTHLTLPTKLEV